MSYDGTYSCHENDSTVTCILQDFILNNSKIIDKSADIRFSLLFKESLAMELKLRKNLLYLVSLCTLTHVPKYK